MDDPTIDNNLGDSRRSQWEAPHLREISIKETQSDDGGNSDTLGGGIFLLDAPLRPPSGKLSIPAEDKERILNFIRSISSSAENLEAALFNPNEAMTNAGLTKNQMRMAKGIFNHLGV